MSEPPSPLPSTYARTLRVCLEHYADPQTGDTQWLAHCGPFTAVSSSMLGALEGLAVMAPQIREGLDEPRPSGPAVHGAN